MKVSKEDLIKLIQSVLEIPSDINVDSNFNELGFDSMDYASLILEIEEKYNIKISNDQYDNLNSINNILTFLNK
jgi:acyl carrier protein